jgi:transposase
MLLDSARQTIITKKHFKLWFQDEARFGRMSDPVYCWAPPGIRPHVKLQRVRQYCYAYSAVCPEDGDTFSLVLPYADTEGMGYFMDAFLQAYPEEHHIMIGDQAAWHTAKSILNRNDRIRFEYQPPYSPELNPAEHYWKYLRTNYFHNKDWPSIEELEDYLAQALEDSRVNHQEELQSLFAFNWIMDALFIV